MKKFKLKLVPFDTVMIDIYPPYDEMCFIFLNTLFLRCPKCYSEYTKKDLNLRYQYEAIVCLNCGFNASLKNWHINTSLKN